MDSQQQPTQADKLLTFLGWVELNKRRLIIWGVVALVLIIASIAFAQYQSQKEKRASEAVSNVPTPLNPSTPVPPQVDDNFLAVAKEHSGTRAAARALLMAATTRFTEGAYADAQKLYEQFIRDYPNSEWVAQAHYGIAAAYEAQKNDSEALARYDRVRRQFVGNVVVDDAKLSMARIYERQSKPADALKLYNELIENLGYAPEAQARKDELLDKHPELAPSNPPPTMATAPLMSLTNRMTVTNAPRPAPMVVPGTNAPRPSATVVPPANSPQATPPAPAVAKPAPAPAPTNASAK